MKFVKTLAKLWLIMIFALIIIVVFLICPVGIIIVAIVQHNIFIFLTGLIWLITAVSLIVFEEDEVRRLIKEEFKK